MLKKLLSLFFPDLCAGCAHILIENENLICIACRHKMPLTNHLLIHENEGFKKFYGRILVEHVSAMLYYHKKGGIYGVTLREKLRVGLSALSFLSS
jgi:predicted amidophosphoribosyltransferase